MGDEAGDKVLAAVRDLLPTLAERAEETEKAREVPAESIQAIQDAGVYRLLQPKRYGGLEAHPVAFYESVALIASACGASGWVSSVLGVHPWHLGLFEQQAQDDVWKDGGDVIISSSYAPMGRAKQVDGGVRLSGRWSFSSGSAHGAWNLLGGLVLGEDGNPIDYRTFLVPRDTYEIVDVWDTVGLRGTGSNDIVVEEAFIPEHHTLSMLATATCRCPGQEINDGPLFRMPYGTIHPYAITAPLIGMARGAYESYVGYTRERVRASYLGEKAAKDQFAQVRVGEAASDIDASWLQLVRNIGEEYELAVAGEKLPTGMRLRARRDQVIGSSRVIAAVDKLFESAGGKAINVSAPISRYWRDAHAARAHAANDLERTLVMFGKHEFGVDVKDGLF